MHFGDLDEGVIILSFLQLCKLLLPGSYIILLTAINEFKPEDFGIDFIAIELNSVVSRDFPDESNMYICRILYNI